MNDEKFTVCPICEGPLELRYVLDHPKKGIIRDVPHHICLKCGEVYLSGEAVDYIRSYGLIEKITA